MPAAGYRLIFCDFVLLERDFLFLQENLLHLVAVVEEFFFEVQE